MLSIKALDVRALVGKSVLNLPHVHQLILAALHHALALSISI